MMNVGMGMKYGGIGDTINGLGLANQTAQTYKAMKNGQSGGQNGQNLTASSASQMSSLGFGNSMSTVESASQNTGFIYPTYSAGYGMSGGMGYGNIDMSQIWNKIQS